MSDVYTQYTCRNPDFSVPRTHETAALLLVSIPRFNSRKWGSVRLLQIRFKIKTRGVIYSIYCTSNLSFFQDEKHLN